MASNNFLDIDDIDVLDLLATDPAAAAAAFIAALEPRSLPSFHWMVVLVEVGSPAAPPNRKRQFNKAHRA